MIRKLTAIFFLFSANQALANPVEDIFPMEAYYKNNKGLYIEDPSSGAYLRMNVQLQPRYEFSRFEDDENESSFFVRRARLIFSGQTPLPEWSYKLQIAMHGNDGENGEKVPDLRDGFIQYAPTDRFKIKFGQMHHYFSRFRRNSSSAMQFTERLSATSLLAFNRNIGLQSLFSFLEDRLEIGATLFNGNSEGEVRNAPGIDTRHSGELMIRGNILGEMDPEKEGDPGFTEVPALNTALVFWAGREENERNDVLDDARLGLDLNFKYQGFSFHSEYLRVDRERGDSLGGGEVTPESIVAQSGMMVTDKLEFVVRAGYTDCDPGDGSLCDEDVSSINEAGAGLNYYLLGDGFKLQLTGDYQELNQQDREDTSSFTTIFQISAYL